MGFLSVLIPPAVAAILTLAAWLTVWQINPDLVATLYDRFTNSPIATGLFLFLYVVGADVLVVSARNAMSYRNVGAKVAAQFRLGRKW